MRAWRSTSFALVGSLVFYGLDHLRGRLQETATAGHAGLDFKLHIGRLRGIRLAEWRICWCITSRETPVTIAFYAVAIAFHFLAVDNELHHEHGDLYKRVGRFVLAAMSMLGWGAGLLFALPNHVIALMLAFLSGAVIMNSTIMELPSDKDGRFRTIYDRRHCVWVDIAALGLTHRAQAGKSFCFQSKTHERVE